jgi:hypothetical protein
LLPLSLPLALNVVGRARSIRDPFPQNFSFSVFQRFSFSEGKSAVKKAKPKK